VKSGWRLPNSSVRVLFPLPGKPVIHTATGAIIKVYHIMEEAAGSLSTSIRLH